MVGIKLNNKHTLNDLGWNLKSHEIGTPSPKTYTIKVEGADGVLDYTEFFGDVKFNNRQLEFVLTKSMRNEEFLTDWSKFQNNYQGRKINIIVDDDPNYHYVGRITLGYSKDRNIYEITIKADCEPYKLKNEKTVYRTNRNGMNLLNRTRMRTVPKFITCGETKITHNGIEYNLSQGEFVIPEIEFGYDANVFYTEQNFLKYPFYQTTKTQNGVTFTDNADGNVTVSGTATADATFYFRARSESFKIPSDSKYRLIGCPSGGSSTSFYMYSSYNVVGESETHNILYDYGNGAEHDLTTDMEIGFYIVIKSGTVCDNLVFAPVLTGTTIVEYQEGEL